MPVPLIVVGTDELAVGDQGIQALVAAKEVFAHAGELVWLVPAHDDCTVLGGRSQVLCIEPLPQARLRELLSRFARWALLRSDDPTDLVPTPVPVWAVRAIAARRRWPGLPVLTGLVTMPTFRPDGTILDTPGYDPATGLFHAPDDDYPTVPLAPTLEDAQVAIEELLAVVREIHFSTAADRAAWLACLLTPLARFAIPGPAPLHLFEGGPPGALPDLLSLTASILCGRTMPTVNAAELVSARRRSVGRLTATGDPTALITGVTSPPGPGWARLLGELQRERTAHRVAWYVLGASIPRGLDLSACLRIGQESGRAARLRSPEQPVRLPRSDLSAQRKHLIVAALKILRAWHVAGRPLPNLHPLPGFDGWSEVVRAALVWCGQPDPVPGSDMQPSADEIDRAASADLLAGWVELAATLGGECSVRQAFDVLLRAPPTQFVRLRTALPFFVPGPLTDRRTADRLGRLLTQRAMEPIDGLQLHCTGSGNQGNRWAVREVGGSLDDRKEARSS